MNRIQVAQAPGIGMLLSAAASAALAVALCAASMIVPARAQEMTTMTADTDASTSSRDGTLLSALGLDLATLEQTEDAALLWRAVRELVLPGKVSVETQRRILRRVWLADPDIRRGSFFASEAH